MYKNVLEKLKRYLGKSLKMAEYGCTKLSFLTLAKKKKKSELVFSELWKLTKGLKESREHLFKNS